MFHDMVIIQANVPAHSPLRAARTGMCQ